MSKRHEIHVVSNTHWDREWLNNFQETRMMLVEFFDRLLEILDNHPDYDSYLLDSQAVPVEDYLELRPEAEDRIRAHVTDGRLMIGPWYTDPECFLINGESLVRNLVYGHRVARSFGKVMKVGHTPFSYGQNSQMPQIYKGFGIDTILFYHGVDKDEVPNEFIFEGADGTQVLGSQMSSGARYNFYHNIYRAVVYGETINDREYTWPMGGLPFHRCGERHAMEHHLLLDPVKRYLKSRIKNSVQQLRAAEIAVATTRYLAFMQGHDSSLPDEVTLAIIKEARKHLPNDTILHSNLPALMEKVKAAAKNLTVLRGERRTPGLCDVRYHLYSDVTSSRTRMKRLNIHAEQMLQHWAEPFAAVAWSLGADYPAAQLDLAWKTLLKCHAHDSIAGSGVDDIERDMMYRLRQVMNISEGIARRGLEQVQLRIDNSDVPTDDIVVTVFNPSPFPRTEIVTAALDLPATSGYAGFSIVEAGKKRPQPVQMVSREPHHSVVNHAGNATAMMACDRAVCRFQARAIPGMGYATYRLHREPVICHDRLVTGLNTMQNEHLAVRINADGTLRIANKATGAVFDGLHYFEDGGEAGHAWMHIEPGLDRIVTSVGSPATVALEEDGPFLARYRVVCRMTIPAGLDENGGDPWKRLDGAPSPCKRTDEAKELTIRSWITLKKGARAVEVVTRFDNACKNHRLRVMFPTRLDASVCHAETAFDVVERPIEYGPDSPWHKRSIDPTFPMHRFVDVSDGTNGLSVINEGLREYQVTSDTDRAIALTLMRAYEVSLTTVSKRWEIHPEMELSQCQGRHEFRYAIYPHARTWAEGETLAEAERLAVEVEPVQAGTHSGDLPKRMSFLIVEPSNLAVSAVKRAEDGDGLVVRLFNPTGKRVDGTIRCHKRIQTAERFTLEELPDGALQPKGKSVSVRVEKKKIVTVRIRLAE
ncbi:MAG: hypothetical protein GY851_18825 [bacterium]|nr:hypothetical protein [bacterium]